jgi:hypothetical protein
MFFLWLEAEFIMPIICKLRWPRVEEQMLNKKIEKLCKNQSGILKQ